MEMTRKRKPNKLTPAYNINDSVLHQ